MTSEAQKTEETLEGRGKGEAHNLPLKGVKQGITRKWSESPNFKPELMEEILTEENLREALKRVKANKGCAGIDKMEVEELGEYLRKYWKYIKEQLLKGTYRPKAVKRVEIPKPSGGVRNLGIPTVLDRFIQQATLQILQRGYDSTFSESSYGFRPSRSAQQAVRKAQEYQKEGYGVVVDIDLEKFFDQVNHDRLMGRMAKEIEDKRVLKLIRGYLQAGVMINGLVSTPDSGTPQGGPLSPLLSNIVLDEMDKELEKRGHRFVRYADDCNIYVKSIRAGQRVMESLTVFIERKLKLKVNKAKSAVAKPIERKFLGFSFIHKRIRIAGESVKRFKDRIREITRTNRRIAFEEMVEELTVYMRGWIGYYKICETHKVLEDLECWIRHRLRNYIWQQWKKYKTRYTNLMQKGIGEELAKKTASSGKGSWRISHCQAMQIAYPINFFDKMKIPRLVKA